MGIFSVNAGIGRWDDGGLTPVQAIVDTGSTHSMFPASLLSQMGVEPLEYGQYGLADGSVVEFGFGMANIGIEGRQLPCPVIFGPNDQYLLGATTLEIFTLKVDPAEERLVPKKLHARIRLTAE